MNVEKYRAAAEEIIRAINARGKPGMVVGGSGLYVKALTHGLAKLPSANLKLREALEHATIAELFRSLAALDPAGAQQIDRQNKRRLIRAVEVCLLTGKPFSQVRSTGILPVGPVGILPADAERQDAYLPHRQDACATGVLIYRDRAELYARIDQRVEQMFREGVVEEVRRLGEIGPTAEKTLGLREIRALIAGEISERDCIEKMQQGTRRYAKRQLTWFQRQSNFEPLNLSSQGYSEAIDLISRNASHAFANG